MYKKYYYLHSIFTAPGFLILMMSASDKLTKNIKDNRWKSKLYNFFSRNCKNPKESTTNCRLEDYVFGPNMTKKSFPNINSQQSCTDECQRDKKCNFISWNQNRKICSTMESGSTSYLGKNPSIDFKYFCQKTNYTVIKMVDPCESMKNIQFSSGKLLRNNSVKRQQEHAYIFFKVHNYGN